MRGIKNSRSAGTNPAEPGSGSSAQVKRSAKKGLPPGTLVHVGTPGTGEIEVSVVEYNNSEIRERKGTDVQELLQDRLSAFSCWIDVSGVHRESVIEDLGSHFKVHPLVLEDVLHTNQRPKVEDYESHLFIVLKMLRYDDRSGKVGTEQISLILGSDFLLSFRERKDELFDSIRARMRVAAGRLRTSGIDYLAYCLIDLVVDHYFDVLEKLSERIELLEEGLVTAPSPDMLRGIHKLKRELLTVRKSIWPIREVLNRLTGGESPLIRHPTEIYFRDVFDHAIHAVDALETFREMVSGMLDIYLSSISNKTNEIMKVLTIIATIFIPLTFLAGWYGMNFKYMPELNSPWGYPAVLLAAVAAVVIMLVFFRRKKWF